MRKLIFFSLCLLATLTTAISQELNATVTLDAVQTGQPNLQVFRTLQQQLTEFLNTTNWTGQEVKNQEKIDCNFTIIVSEFQGTSFTASLQIQASRPVFGATYDSPIYSYNDRDFNFDYSEFEPLRFNANTFDSNLISVLAYHAYTIIGIDAATFERDGGITHFQTAKQIINTAASSGYKGWRSADGRQTRYHFNDALLGNVYANFHDTLYEYHRLGLDKMAQSPKLSKGIIVAALAKLKSIHARRPNSFLMRVFFDGKADEIQAIFSGGPSVNIAQLVDDLNRMAPTKSTQWSKIKF